MKITKVTIGRLYNLGNYEHVRYEITGEVGPDESAAKLLVGMERVMAGLKPDKTIPTQDDIRRAEMEVSRMIAMNDEEWRRAYGHCTGTRAEVTDRYKVSLAEKFIARSKSIERSKKARELFDDLGGAAQWKDAKLDWQDDDDFTM